MILRSSIAQSGQNQEPSINSAHMEHISSAQRVQTIRQGWLWRLHLIAIPSRFIVLTQASRVQCVKALFDISAGEVTHLSAGQHRAYPLKAVFLQAAS